MMSSCCRVLGASNPHADYVPSRLQFHRLLPAVNKQTHRGAQAVGRELPDDIVRGPIVVQVIVITNWFVGVGYVFGAILVISGFKLAFGKDKKVQPEKNPVLKIFRRLMPVSTEYSAGRFSVKRETAWAPTPLFVVLLMVETTDLVFAVDSVPAVLAITTDPFIVYASNVFAILGLRSMFFALAGVMRLFHYLHHGLAAVLVLVPRCCLHLFTRSQLWSRCW